jgi:ribosomal protein S12 methylthiotransferase accessory factor YcaO
VNLRGQREYLPLEKQLISRLDWSQSKPAAFRFLVEESLTMSPRLRWLLASPTAPRRRFSNLRGQSNRDILLDIDFELGRLHGAGLDQAIVVDLTPPDWKVRVVRVFVPGLERPDLTRLGWRGKRYLLEAAAFFRTSPAGRVP